jgi:ribosomal protein L10
MENKKISTQEVRNTLANRIVNSANYTRDNNGQYAIAFAILELSDSLSKLFFEFDKTDNIDD